MVSCGSRPWWLVDPNFRGIRMSEKSALYASRRFMKKLREGGLIDARSTAPSC